VATTREIVLPFSQKSLRSCFAEAAAAFLSDRCYSHLEYFCDYFTAHPSPPRAIVIERDYVDRDYLTDYANYYVTCFSNRYRRFCIRLHFFSIPFSEDHFSALLHHASSSITIDQLQQSYLGFVVLKPLPKTIIGRTCLKTYDREPGRDFLATRPYNANLFGIPLQVESLAFQEQDTAVAACATSALWSVFQITGKTFQHKIPSPVEITKIAAESNVTLLPNSNAGARCFPSDGLSLEQMILAIRSLGLDADLIRLTSSDSYLLLAATRAYLACHLPPLLIGELKCQCEKHIGLHAVAIAGYCISRRTPVSVVVAETKEFHLTSGRIDKLYVHDDGVMPFARITEASLGTWTTSWKCSHCHAKIGSVHMSPTAVIIPLYHKVRISFIEVLHWVAELQQALTHITNAIPDILPTPIEWDIRLQTVQELKKDIITSPLPIHSTLRAIILTKAMPRFIWRVTATARDNVLTEFLIDATELKQANPLCAVIPMHRDFHNVLKDVAKYGESLPLLAQMYMAICASTDESYFTEQL
jgi:hypothetical protein